MRELKLNINGRRVRMRIPVKADYIELKVWAPVLGHDDHGKPVSGWRDAHLSGGLGGGDFGLTDLIVSLANLVPEPTSELAVTAAESIAEKAREIPF